MSPQTTKTLYWILIIIFSLFMVMDGIGGIAQTEAGQQAMTQLGYPFYVMSFLGWAKILGVLGILQNKFPRLKEWAFAGFTINFIGAAASWIFVSGPAFSIILPIIMLIVMFIIYFLGKKLTVHNV